MVNICDIEVLDQSRSDTCFFGALACADYKRLRRRTNRLLADQKETSLTGLATTSITTLLLCSQRG
jgi:hypothetical protein